MMKLASFHLAFLPALLISALMVQGSFTIHPGGSPNECLDVRGAVFEPGTPVQIYKCNGTPAQQWFINEGNTVVQLTGTDLCLDAGSNPGSGVLMKIWQCYANLPAQAWYYTDDKRIALAGKGQCLDVPNGVYTSGSQVQTWKCTDNDAYQVWTTTPNPNDYCCPSNRPDGQSLLSQLTGPYAIDCLYSHTPIGSCYYYTATGQFYEGYSGCPSQAPASPILGARCPKEVYVIPR